MSPRRKLIVVLFFVAVCIGVPVGNHYLRMHREEVTPSDLYQIVYSQVNAFRAENFPLAYSHASNGIQQKFNPEQFAKMIRRDYGDITHAERIEFGIVKYREEHALMQVFFIGHDGSVLPCIYSLIFEGDAWKIDGARMLPRWPAGAEFEGIRV